MKTILTAIFCSLSSLWAVAQTTGGAGGGLPVPGPDNNHGYATPSGGAFVTPGKGFIAPGTGNHGFASPGQTNGFIAPGHGFVAPGRSFITPGSGNGFVTPNQPPTNSPPKT
jgi:hypothetical protein